MYEHRLDSKYSGQFVVETNYVFEYFETRQPDALSPPEEARPQRCHLLLGLHSCAPNGISRWSDRSGYFQTFYRSKVKSDIALFIRTGLPNFL